MCRMFFWVTFPSAATVPNCWPLLLLDSALLGVCASILEPLSDNGEHTPPKTSKCAGWVCSLPSKALPPRGFLPRQDITWRRLFTDLAWVQWEPRWGWEWIKHLQGDCSDLAEGKAVVSWIELSCVLSWDFICEHSYSGLFLNVIFFEKMFMFIPKEIKFKCALRYYWIKEING